MFIKQMCDYVGIVENEEEDTNVQAIRLNKKLYGPEFEQEVMN